MGYNGKVKLERKTVKLAPIGINSKRKVSTILE